MKRKNYLAILLLLLTGSIRAGAQSYCGVSTVATGYMYISNVTLGTVTSPGGIVSNSSGDGGGYQDFTGVVVSMFPGTTLPVSISCGTSSYMVYSFWLDTNNDGVFSPSESLGAYNSPDNPTNTSLAIPAGLNGNYRLRIRSEFWGYGAPTDPCGSVSYGETEDYMLAIAPPPCPSTLSASNITTSQMEGQTATTFSWTVGNGTGHLVIVKSGSPINTAAITNGTTYAADTNFAAGSMIDGGYVVYAGAGTSVTVSNLAAGTTYYVAIVEYNTACLQYKTANPATTSFMDVPGSCIPTATYPGYMYTSSVTVGNVTTTSDGSHLYNDYSGMVIDATGGYPLPVSVTTGGPNGWVMDYCFWLDANNDGVFADSERLAVFYNDDLALDYSTQLNMPTSYGYHKLRIRADGTGFGVFTDPCAEVYFGDAEDYTINVKPFSCPANINTTNLAVVGQLNNSTTLGWTSGNGTSRVVIVKAGSPANPASLAGAAYTANTVYSTGSMVDGGYVVYSGNGNTVTVTGLAGNVTYYATVVEYTNTCMQYQPAGVPTLAFLQPATLGCGIFAPGMALTPTSTNSPAAEQATNAIDGNPNTKYLNFDISNTGFTVNTGSSSVATALSITTANDAPERDPVGYTVAGSNDGSNFTAITSGSLSCNTSRLTGSIHTFANSTAYQYYRIVFPAICNSIIANSMQVAEVQLYHTGYEITATAGAYGAISPAGTVTACGSQVYTITPLPGSTIADVLVDGVSVGAVAAYTFTNVSAAHTISATFHGPAGKALAFDGTDDYVQVAHSLNAADQTLEAWVQPQSTARMYAISNDNAGNYGAGFGLNNLQLEIDCHNQFIALPAATFTAGAWAHVAVVYQSDARVRAYVNGVEVYNAIPNTGWPASLDGTAFFTIGRYNAGLPLSWNGSIDEVRVWNRALCQTEIQNDMNGSLPNPAAQPGLVALYSFNQGYIGADNSAITTLADSSGNGNTGTLYHFNLTASNTTSNFTGGPIATQSTGNQYAPQAPVSSSSQQLRSIAGNTVFTDCGIIADVVPTGSGTAVSGNVMAKVTLDNAPGSFNGDAYVQRHYDITPATNINTATATITLYFLQSDFTAYNAATTGAHLPGTGSNTDPNIGNLRITQYHGTSATGLPGSYTYTGNGQAVQLITPTTTVWNAAASRWEVTFPVTGFSGFFVSAGLNAPLPVTLKDIAAANEGPRNKIEWHSEDETGTAAYELEHSTDGISFSRIETVPAQGSAWGYMAYDNNPAMGNTYYRLKVVATSGAFSYSQTVKAIRTVAGAISLQAYPNPIGSSLTVDVYGATSGTVTISDATGRAISRQSLIDGHAIFGTGMLAAGIYFVTYNGANAAQTIRVSKE